MELQELQVMYDSSQRERAELEEELQRCKAELEKLSGGSQVSDRHPHLNTAGRQRVSLTRDSNLETISSRTSTRRRLSAQNIMSLKFSVGAGRFLSSWLV